MTEATCNTCASVRVCSFNRNPDPDFQKTVHEQQLVVRRCAMHFMSNITLKKFDPRTHTAVKRQIQQITTQ